MQGVVAGELGGVEGVVRYGASLPKRRVHICYVPRERTDSKAVFKEAHFVVPSRDLIGYDFVHE